MSDLLYCITYGTQIAEGCAGLAIGKTEHKAWERLNGGEGWEIDKAKRYGASVGRCEIVLHDGNKPSVGQWQPIETAPKDGTEILAYGRKQDGAYFVAFEYGDWWCAGPWDEGWCELNHAPTHWMPLPEPPK